MINSIKAIEVEGTIIERYDTQHPSDRFRYKEFVLEVNTSVDNETSIDQLKMRLIQERCELLDDLRKGFRILVTFRILGRKYTRKTDGQVGYITNLEALNIQLLDDSNNFENDKPIPDSKHDMPPPPPDPYKSGESDDLPF